mgnify:CR=1 FL=1
MKFALFAGVAAIGVVGSVSQAQGSYEEGIAGFG